MIAPQVRALSRGMERCAVRGTRCREKRESEAAAARLKGNRFYRGKRWEKALEFYTASLRQNPYAVATLSNIAQVRLSTRLA